MKLTVNFKHPLSNKEVADKLRDIATLMEHKYRGGKDIPFETDWELELPKDKNLKFKVNS